MDAEVIRMLVVALVGEATGEQRAEMTNQERRISKVEQELTKLREIVLRADGAQLQTQLNTIMNDLKELREGQTSLRIIDERQNTQIAQILRKLGMHKEAKAIEQGFSVYIGGKENDVQVIQGQSEDIRKSTDTDADPQERQN